MDDSDDWIVREPAADSMAAWQRRGLQLSLIADNSIITITSQTLHPVTSTTNNQHGECPTFAEPTYDKLSYFLIVILHYQSHRFGN